MRRGRLCGLRLDHTGKHASYERVASKKEKREPTHYLASAERLADRIRLVEEIKLSRGCADCGYDKYPEALDFDHLPGVEKLGNVAQMINYSMDKLMAEIAKCEVVCANCHRHRTRERGYARG